MPVDDQFRANVLEVLQDPGVVNLLHSYSDILDPQGQHHVLGLTHEQASYGDHAHTGVDSASVQLDNIVDGTGWTAYAPVATNGATTSTAGAFRKIGTHTALVVARLVFSGAPTGRMETSLPVTANAIFGAGVDYPVGNTFMVHAGAHGGHGVAIVNAASNRLYSFHKQDAGYADTAAAAPFAWAAGDILYFSATLPI